MSITPHDCYRTRTETPDALLQYATPVLQCCNTVLLCLQLQKPVLKYPLLVTWSIVPRLGLHRAVGGASNEYDLESGTVMYSHSRISRRIYIPGGIPGGTPKHLPRPPPRTTSNVQQALGKEKAVGRVYSTATPDSTREQTMRRSARMARHCMRYDCRITSRIGSK